MVRRIQKDPESRISTMKEMCKHNGIISASTVRRQLKLANHSLLKRPRASVLVFRLAHRRDYRLEEMQHRAGQRKIVQRYNGQTIMP